MERIPIASIYSIWQISTGCNVKFSLVWICSECKWSTMQHRKIRYTLKNNIDTGDGWMDGWLAGQVASIRGKSIVDLTCLDLASTGWREVLIEENVGLGQNWLDWLLDTIYWGNSLSPEVKHGWTARLSTVKWWLCWYVCVSRLQITYYVCLKWARMEKKANIKQLKDDWRMVVRQEG